MSEVRPSPIFSSAIVSFAVSPSLNPKVDFDNSIFGYHCRLSHMGLKSLKILLQSSNITPSSFNGVDVQGFFICVKSKMHRSSFNSCSPYCSTFPGQLITPKSAPTSKSLEKAIPISSPLWKTTPNTTIYPMKHKSDSFQCFMKIFQSFFEKSGQYKILALRTDNGREHLSKKFSSYLLSASISHFTGPPHSPESNSAAERTNC